MKKIFIISIIIVLIFSLTSCNEKKGYAVGNKAENFGEDIKIIKPTVTFETNGGTSLRSVDTFLIEIEPVTTKQYHHFDGWYLDSTFNSPAVFPMNIEHDTKLYAKWTLVCYQWEDKDPNKIESNLLEVRGFTYDLTPKKFNLTRLAELGYNINITITYDAYYKKTYDALWDIGYLGAPEFETSIKKTNTLVHFETVQRIATKPQSYTITYNATASDLSDDSLTLKFSSDNIQNAIYFENIRVIYTCYK